MSDTDKTPTQCETVQGKDSPCAVQERQRLRARVRAMIADWIHESSREGQSLMFYDDCVGRIRGLWQVVNMLEEDATHD